MEIGLILFCAQGDVTGTVESLQKAREQGFSSQEGSRSVYTAEAGTSIETRGPVETTAVFASSQITHIFTLHLHIPAPGSSAKSKLTNISTADQQLCITQHYTLTPVHDE
ncbi:unnamed protein product [Pleuronectes platessa]|uniref:Uncharacterized protein n=1 Tax=Pleuronectes platessa TaxID=8262 RepID=A0A9N7U3F2_PLEPL|nr:unnamed protein product [Pleuronectes platessa]